MNDLASKSDADKILDQILNADVMIPLPEDFAIRIARKAVRRMALKQSMTEFLVYAGVIIAAVASVLTVNYFFGQANWTKWTDFLASNLNFATGTVVVLFFILFMDSVLLPMLFATREEKVTNQF